MTIYMSNFPQCLLDLNAGKDFKEILTNNVQVKFIDQNSIAAFNFFHLFFKHFNSCILVRFLVMSLWAPCVEE